jgi:hypothetical protein
MCRRRGVDRTTRQRGKFSGYRWAQHWDRQPAGHCSRAACPIVLMVRGNIDTAFLQHPAVVPNPASRGLARPNSYARLVNRNEDGSLRPSRRSRVASKERAATTSHRCAMARTSGTAMRHFGAVAKVKKKSPANQSGSPWGRLASDAMAPKVWDRGWRSRSILDMFAWGVLGEESHRGGQ